MEIEARNLLTPHPQIGHRLTVEVVEGESVRTTWKTLNGIGNRLRIQHIWADVTVDNSWGIGRL